MDYQEKQQQKKADMQRRNARKQKRQIPTETN